MCVSVCCVRASPCTTHAIGHLRPPPLPSSPRYVPLQKRENRRRGEEDDGATKRAIGGTGTAVSARYAFTRRLYPFADILSPRIFTCLSPFIPFDRRGWNIYRLENTKARVVRFGLKKKEGEREVWCQCEIDALSVLTNRKGRGGKSITFVSRIF